MDLGSFSSVFEVAVGLNIAFIAAEYASSYTNLVAKYVYRLYDRINQQFLECESIVDKNTVDSLEGNTLDGKNTLKSVEEIKIRYASKKKELDDKRNGIINEVGDRCHFRCFAFVSLYLTLYSLAALFVSGFNEYTFSKNFWAVFLVLSSVFMLGYSFVVRNGWCRKTASSLAVCMISFVVVALLSLVAESILEEYGIVHAEWFAVLVKHSIWFSAIMPYANFVVFVFIMKVRSGELFKEVVDTINKLKPEWMKMKTVVSDLCAVNRVSADLKSKTPEKSKNSRSKKE